MDRFVRFGLVSGVVGGGLLALGSGITVAAAGGRPLSVQTTTSAYVLGSTLRLLGAIGMLLGISGLAARCAPRGAAFLLSAYALAVAGLALNLGWIWSDLFVSDSFAAVAPGVLDGSMHPGARLDIGALTAWIGNVSLVVLAIAVARTRTVRRASWVALLLAGAVTLVPLPFDGPVYEVLIGVAFAVGIGLALRDVPDVVRLERSGEPARVG
jgi:hypothetical protein